MAARDYVAGFQVAGGGKANVVDLSAAAAGVAAYGLEQAEETRKRQKEFDENRAAFKKEMADTYDQYVRENNFDDTGILDYDAATEKLRNSIKQSHLETEYLYDQGTIDEAEVRRRNNEMKGQVGEVKNLSADIVAYQEKVQKLEEEGKGSEVNGLRTDILEAFSENFNVVSTAKGLQYQTVVDGEVKGINAGEFKRILNAEQGVDIEKDLDDLVKLGGLEEKIEGYGRDAKKVTEYLRGEEGNALLKTRIDQWSASEKYDYMLKAGLATDDPAIAKEGKIKLIDGASIFKKEVSEDEDQAIADHMEKELTNRLLFKGKKELYDDKYTLQQIKDKNAANRTVKSLVESADIVQTDEDSKDKQRVREVYSKDGKGIPVDYLVQTPGNNISRAMMDSIEGIPGGTPVPFDAIKNTKFIMERGDIDTGLIEITLGYDYDVPKEKENSLVEAIGRMSDVKRRQSIRKYGKEAGLGDSEIQAIADDPQKAVSFLTDRAPKKGSSTFKYVPQNLTEYNRILTNTGRKPISDADWSKHVSAVKSKQNWANKKFSRNQ
tara:strand:+ start:360 stop:2009 length:1650 start_codon:yes stop_codon:yes gene_type:complete